MEMGNRARDERKKEGDLGVIWRRIPDERSLGSDGARIAEVQEPTHREPRIRQRICCQLLSGLGRGNIRLRLTISMRALLNLEAHHILSLMTRVRFSLLSLFPIVTKTTRQSERPPLGAIQIAYQNKAIVCEAARTRQSAPRTQRNGPRSSERQTRAL